MLSKKRWISSMVAKLVTIETYTRHSGVYKVKLKKTLGIIDKRYKHYTAYSKLKKF